MIVNDGFTLSSEETVHDLAGQNHQIMFGPECVISPQGRLFFPVDKETKRTEHMFCADTLLNTRPLLKKRGLLCGEHNLLEIDEKV